MRGFTVPFCLAVAALIALPLAPAVAQNSLPMPGLDLHGDTVSPQVKEKREKIDQDYRNATQKLQNQDTGTRDPWANMRGAEPAKPAADKPKPKAAAAKKPAQ